MKSVSWTHDFRSNNGGRKMKKALQCEGENTHREFFPNDLCPLGLIIKWSYLDPMCYGAMA